MIKLESKIEQFSDKYTFKFTTIDPQDGKTVFVISLVCDKALIFVFKQTTESLYYGDYFNEKGDLVLQNVDKLLKSILKNSKI